MTKWLNTLEYKLRRRGIDNLMMYITVTMLAVYLAEQMFRQPISYYLALIMNDPMGQGVLNGQVWRLITFIFVPPTNDIIWILLELYFYYWIGSTLENTWGRTKFTMFYAFGMIGAIIAAVITGAGTNRFLNLSMFLAFAALDPNREIMLWFVIPVKVKILAYIDLGLLLFAFITSGLPGKLAIVVSLLNLILFFSDTFLDMIRNYKKYGKQRRNFRKSMKRNRDMYGR